MKYKGKVGKFFGSYKRTKKGAEEILSSEYQLPGTTNYNPGLNNRIQEAI